MGLIPIILILLALHFGREPKVELDSGLRPTMGTFARVVAIADDQQTAAAAVEDALAEIYRVDELMSDYREDSQISKVNREAFAHPVEVSPLTFEVLQRSVEFSRLSDSAFDITIGPLVDLWRRSADANSAPTEAELAAARSKIGYEKLILDPNQMTVRFAVEGMRLDLGAIAKGYAIDRAVEALQNAGAVGGLIDIGGDVRCFGVPAGAKRHWIVGLQDPGTAMPGLPGRKVLLKLKIADAAVATSGDYQQFVIIQGRHHSHILDHTTGTSAHGLSSVTIIADNAANADALATAVTVLGKEKGLALIEKIPNTEAILIPSDEKRQLLKTSGAERYLK
jgi:thiamine biosynthesis lipoprotein